MWVQHVLVQCVGGVLSVPNGIRGTEMVADEVQSVSKWFGDLERMSEHIRACRTHIRRIVRVIQDCMKSQGVGGSEGMYHEVIMSICKLVV